MSVDYNKWLKRLDTQLNEQTNKNSIEVSKVVKATNKKCYHKTLGTTVIRAQWSLSSCAERLFSIHTNRR